MILCSRPGMPERSVAGCQALGQPIESWRLGALIALQKGAKALLEVRPGDAAKHASAWLTVRVRGKALCEIGTRNGDIAACLAHHASSVTAIEMDRVYCRKLRARGSAEHSINPPSRHQEPTALA